MITITVRIPHQQHNTHAIRLFIIFIVLSLAIASIKSKLSTNMMMPVISIFISNKLATISIPSTPYRYLICGISLIRSRSDVNHFL